MLREEIRVHVLEVHHLTDDRRDVRCRRNVRRRRDVRCRRDVRRRRDVRCRQPLHVDLHALNVVEDHRVHHVRHVHLVDKEVPLEPARRDHCEGDKHANAERCENIAEVVEVEHLSLEREGRRREKLINLIGFVC